MVIDFKLNSVSKEVMVSDLLTIFPEIADEEGNLIESGLTYLAAYHGECSITNIIGEEIEEIKLDGVWASLRFVGSEELCNKLKLVLEEGLKNKETKIVTSGLVPLINFA